MVYKIFEDTIVLRLEKGEEVISSIKEVCEKEKITLGTITGLGAANSVTIGLFKTKEKKYYSTNHKEDFEITNLTGNISTMNNEVYLHIHGTFANIDGVCIGGHLNEAIISATAEIFIKKVNGSIDRKFSDEIGLNLIEM